MRNSNIKNIFLLVITAMIWGGAFVAQSDGMNYVGPFSFLSLRSFLGGVFLLPYAFIIRKHSKSNRLSYVDEVVSIDDHTASKKELLLGGILAGIALMVASSLQQIGIQYTTVGKAGFLTALYVIIVPFLNFLLFRKKLNRNLFFCVALSLAGMIFLCFNDSEALNSQQAAGDLLELLCAVAFSFHILILDKYTDKVDPVKLSCIQFFVCGIISLVPMVILEQPSLQDIANIWLPLLYAGVLSSGIGYTLQAVAQRNCDPTLAAIIMCLESVFSAIFGWLILNQSLSPKEITGCVLMFAAIILANITPTPGNKK